MLTSLLPSSVSRLPTFRAASVSTHLHTEWNELQVLTLRHRRLIPMSSLPTSRTWSNAVPIRAIKLLSTLPSPCHVVAFVSLPSTLNRLIQKHDYVQILVNYLKRVSFHHIRLAAKLEPSIHTAFPFQRGLDGNEHRFHYFSPALLAPHIQNENQI